MGGTGETLATESNRVLSCHSAAAEGIPMTAPTPEERGMKCWACRRRVLRSFSHDISLCQGCGLLFQRVTILSFGAPWWHRVKLKIATRLYFFAVSLTLHPEYDL